MNNKPHQSAVVNIRHFFSVGHLIFNNYTTSILLRNECFSIPFSKNCDCYSLFGTRERFLKQPKLDLRAHILFVIHTPNQFWDRF